MDLDGRRESTNVEDRRGMSGGAKAGLGGGIIGIIIAMVFAFMGGGNGGIDLGSVIGQMGNITQEQPRDDAEDAHKLANIISSKTKNPSSSSEITSHAAVLRQFIVENYGIPDEQVGRVD